MLGRVGQAHPLAVAAPALLGGDSDRARPGGREHLQAEGPSAPGAFVNGEHMLVHHAQFGAKIPSGELATRHRKSGAGSPDVTWQRDATSVNSPEGVANCGYRLSVVSQYAGKDWSWSSPSG